MAGKKDNIKALFSNTRSRVIIILTGFLLLVTVLVGYYKLRSPSEPNLGGARVTAGPGGIQSIPGSMNPTAQYAYLQEKQNLEQAQKAAKTGSSAIPTIVRSQAFGTGVEAVGPQGGTAPLGFSSLTRENLTGPQQSLWIQTLKEGNCSKKVVAEVMKQGAGLADLKTTCTCAQLKDNGYSLNDLKDSCSCPDLKAAGFNATQLKAAGFSAERLVRCGFNACELSAAGFTAQQLKDAGLSDGELKGAGFPESEIARAGGIPEGITDADIRKAGCQVDALKRLREEGVSAAAIRRINGCSASQLKAAGYSAKDLKNAGFTAAELKRAGFSAAQLKDAGYTARDLLNAGFSPAQLAAAGFTPSEINQAESELPPGITPEDVKKAGCSESALKREKAEGISAALIHKYAGCSAAALKAAGFSPADLLKAGFTPAQLLTAGFTPAQLKNAGLSNASDCSVASLERARAAGESAKTIREKLGCSAAALKAAGYTAAQLKAAGFTAAELKAAGFSAAQLKAAGFSAAQLKAAGFSAAQLKAAGFNAAQLKDAGFSAAQLKDAGFTASQLKSAGFTAGDLKAAGFSARDLHNAGFGARELKDAGYTPNELKDAGYANKDMQDAGIALKNSELAELDALAGNQQRQAGASVPSMGNAPSKQAAAAAENEKKLNEILARQKEHMADQQYQQKIQQKVGVMTGAANQALQGWKATYTQVLVSGGPTPKEKGEGSQSETNTIEGQSSSATRTASSGPGKPPVIRAGEVLFAVLDTSVNSDQPGPVLASIVSGRFSGAKLIGSFSMPTNADKLVISFNMMSVPGAAKTTPINAYAIDPNTARTALSSRVDHHYLMRYGALFASTFLEGFGNAFQSAGTTVVIGGSGLTTTTTVSNGVGRSVLENAVIGLATVGKDWGQVAMKNVNTPVTVDVYSGTGLGILFTQDVASI